MRLTVEGTETEELFETLANKSPVGVYIVQDGKFCYTNPTFRSATGYSEEELLSMDSLELVVPEDKESVRENAIKMLRGELTSVYQFRVIHKSGSIRWVMESATSIQYRGRRATLGNYMDITERKEVEEALRASEAKYRALYESIRDGIISTELDGTINDVNQAFLEMVGYESLAELKRTHQDLTPEKWHEFEEEIIRNQVLKRGYSDEYEKEYIRRDGSIFPASIKLWLITKKETPVGIRGIARDITERKRAEEEREALLQDITKSNQRLEEANKELQDFVYVASHDLREPLRKISSFGALLQDSMQGKLDEDQQENFDFMIGGARRMQDMIDALLTYSRLTTRARPPQQVYISEVIENLKKFELSTLLDETQGTIRIPEPLPPVRADQSQMLQLFQNLVGNGLKFHRKGIPPEIIIRACGVENKMIRIEVEDNGIGIDEQYNEQLFTMFKRLHTREQYEGTGIGLAVCKKIVERHGGNIGLKSTPGKGSTFWFTLPRGSYVK